MAAPLPEMKPWPPVFAGEPPSEAVETVLARTLNWHDLEDVARWARLLAYFVSALHNKSPSSLQAIAVLRLRRLLDAGARGLMAHMCAVYVTLHPEPAPPGAAPIRKAPRRKDRAR